MGREAQHDLLDLPDHVQQPRKKGYRLKHASGYAVGNEGRYAAIWEVRNDGVAWVARHGLTSATYQ
jgi:hypothetical protein